MNALLANQLLTMPDRFDYELLDFGNDRKLERFGEVVLDRPSPAADNAACADPSLWNQAGARYEIGAAASAQRGAWRPLSDVPQTWTTQRGSLRFELKLTEFGHVGLFPEQSFNWNWIAERCTGGLSVLNLFAYTGGSTLAAAAAGAAVTHVDAARGVVAWARQNAELSGLAAAPVRWIVEDALKFCRRELQRGRRYDALVLDPPSYGHGPAGEPWKLEEQLPELLDVCRELTGPQPRFILVTSHTPAFDGPRLADCLARADFAAKATGLENGDLWLQSQGGRRLHAGFYARSAR